MAVGSEDGKMLGYDRRGRSRIERKRDMPGEISLFEDRQCEVSPLERFETRA